MKTNVSVSAPHTHTELKKSRYKVPSLLIYSYYVWDQLWKVSSRKSIRMRLNSLLVEMTHPILHRIGRKPDTRLHLGALGQTNPFPRSWPFLDKIWLYSGRAVCHSRQTVLWPFQMISSASSSRKEKKQNICSMRQIQTNRMQHQESETEQKNDKKVHKKTKGRLKTQWNGHLHTKSLKRR
jgi:hypothetical protein